MEPLENVFISNTRSAYQNSFEKTCTLQQLKDVLRCYNIYHNDINIRFLASQYIVSGRSEDIHYQKLIDDTKTMLNAEIGQNFGDPNSICNAVRKKMFVYDAELTEFFSQYAG